MGGAIIAVIFNFIHPMRLPLFPRERIEPGIPRRIWERISYVEPRQAYEELKQNRGLLVDVREQKEFIYGRAKGAVSLPYLGYEKHINGFEAHLPKDTFLYLYDGGGDINISARVAKRLILKGYQRVGVIRGGIIAWAREGLPMEIVLSEVATKSEQ